MNTYIQEASEVIGQGGAIEYNIKGVENNSIRKTYFLMGGPEKISNAYEKNMSQGGENCVIFVVCFIHIFLIKQIFYYFVAAI